MLACNALTVSLYDRADIRVTGLDEIKAAYHVAVKSVERNVFTSRAERNASFASV